MSTLRQPERRGKDMVKRSSPLKHLKKCCLAGGEKGGGKTVMRKNAGQGVLVFTEPKKKGGRLRWPVMFSWPRMSGRHATVGVLFH